MVQQISTSISDAVLALVAMRACLGLLSINLFAALGFGMIASAATFGVIRFAQSTPSWNVLSWHKYLSWLSAASGVPFIAAGYFRQESISNISNLFLAAGVAFAVLRRYASDKLVQDGANVLAGAGMGAMLLDGICRLHMYTSVGAVFFIAAATAVGTEGYLHGMKRVDIFHYLLALSVVAFTIGFNTSPAPIFFKG
jgi:hypothetical protein